jgi:acyl-CoA thioester hydrolase
MSPSPAEERFELPITIYPNDIDELGHVNNVVYVRWVQEVATAHWRSATTPEQQSDLIWVVIRHEIDYKQSAKLGDDIAARTWVGTAGDISFERHTEILRKNDQRVLARARTLWCPIKINTGKPTRVPAEIKERFSVPRNE